MHRPIEFRELSALGLCVGEPNGKPGLPQTSAVNVLCIDAHWPDCFSVLGNVQTEGLGGRYRRAIVITKEISCQALTG